MLCSCSKHDTNIIKDDKEAISVKEVEPIPAFEKEKREILPLPESIEFADSMELVDSLILNYEVLNYQKFETDFV